VTAAEMMKLYADPAKERSFKREEIVALAKAMRQEITFQKFDSFSLSAADAFALLNESLNSYVEKNETPAAVKLIALDGPARSFVQPAGKARPDSISWQAFTDAVRNTAAFYRAHNRMPSEIWFGVETLSPQDYLATLAAVIEEVAASGKKPERVKILSGNFTPDKYAAADSPKLWNWPIHPENFQAPKIMELARLQSWTLKPAVRQK
jgi:hypothetical protein